jgi:hypothetical protein
MDLGHKVSSIVSFLRAGYPVRMPSTGYIPLLALFRRRVTDDEITDIASELMIGGRSPIGNVDIGVEITRVTHEMPSLNDVTRVHERIAAIGHPDTPIG